MCFHASQSKSLTTVENSYNAYRTKAFDIGEHDLSAYHFNGFDHPELAIIPQEYKDQVHPAIWGLVPSNIPGYEQNDFYSKMKGASLNAKSEKIFDYPLYSNSIFSRRCIIPISGFFEFHHFNNKTYPYFIKRADAALFSVAGIYSVGSGITSFTMLTKKAMPFMANIHNKAKRQIVMLPTDLEKDWLSDNLSESQIMELINLAYPDDELTAHTVSKDIVNPTIESNYEAILDPFLYSEIEYRLF